MGSNREESRLSHLAVMRFWYRRNAPLRKPRHHQWRLSGSAARTTASRRVDALVIVDAQDALFAREHPRHMDHHGDQDRRQRAISGKIANQEKRSDDDRRCRRQKEPRVPPLLEQAPPAIEDEEDQVPPHQECAVPKSDTSMEEDEQTERR